MTNVTGIMQKRLGSVRKHMHPSGSSLVGITKAIKAYR